MGNARVIFPALLLLALTVCAYVPATRGGFIWDDDRYVSENPALTHPAGLRAIWLRPGATDQYYPLVFTSFWVEHRIWGTNPAGYHWVNVTLHGLNAVLLWILLTRLGVPCPWFAAAVFAVHPVHVESVAWISERKNVLSGFFYLLAFLAYLRFSPLDATGRDEPVTGSGLGWYAVAFAAFVAALLSKTVTCSLPAVLVLVTWWKRGWPTRREWAALGPMFVVGLALALHTAQMEKQHVGASGPDWAFTPVERCLIAGRALWFYATKLAWPHPLIFVYPRWEIDTSEALQYLYPLGWAGLIAALGWGAFQLPLPRWLAPLHRLGRGPLVAVLVFSGTLVPALGFFNVYPMLFSFVADHFQYLASIPLICLGVAALDAALRWLSIRLSIDGRATVAVVGGVLLAVLGGLTWRQGHAYAGLETLWRDTIAKNPTAWMAHYNLGRLLLDEGRDAEAMTCFEQTVAVNPRHVLGLNNWGHLLKSQAEGTDGDAAARLYDLAAEKTALAIEYDRTRDPRIIRNLAEIHMARKDYAAAIATYEQAIAAIAKHDPKHGFGRLVPDYTHALQRARRLAATFETDPNPGGRVPE